MVRSLMRRTGTMVRSLMRRGGTSSVTPAPLTWALGLSITSLIWVVPRVYVTMRCVSSQSMVAPSDSPTKRNGTSVRPS